MVISFSHEIPWRQIVKDEEVVTFRKRRRKNPNCHTWCNRGRGQTKEFDVKIREIGEVEPTTEELSAYVDRSGFASAGDWIDAIRELNGTIPDTGWLYIVTPASETPLAPTPPANPAP